MRKIKFRDQEYDAEMLVRLAPFGRQETVETANLISSFTCKLDETKTAILLDGKYHLLTGSVDRTQPTHTLRVFSKVILKKALVVKAAPAPTVADVSRTERRKQWNNNSPARAAHYSQGYDNEYY